MKMLLNLDLLRLLLDFGMVVLIWLIQLIIYPSFRYFSEENLRRWHKVYMHSSSLVIIPLMLGQFMIACLQVYQGQTSYTLIGLAILLVLWAHTFYQFVPLHNAIKNDPKPDKIALKLVKTNWWRTLLWNILFLYTCATLAVSG